MSHASWTGQIYYALQAIDCRGLSKHAVKRNYNIRPGQPVPGVFSDGYLNTVFDRVKTFTNWLSEQYSDLGCFRDVDTGLVTEYLAEKVDTCQVSTVRTVLACLRKFQEALYARQWIQEDVIPAEWDLAPGKIHRGAYSSDESVALIRYVTVQTAEFGQALRFISASGARIDETFHLRSDKILDDRQQVELLGKGGRTRRIQLLSPTVLAELDLSARYIYLRAGNGHTWKRGLEDSVRAACDDLCIQRRGVHGFRGSAACEFLRIRTEILGNSESEARRELAMWLGHNPQRSEVTYAYVPRRTIRDARTI